ncbi:uroporphyrinogen decarboxylase family protein [Sulfuricystis thermophila]|uniref:uroporphyrinogen decarboxylase family protein n=1 Tax=Sulfuricystis thermophila TaxID=2496847 RepID=UPI001036AE55|nr:uroporphyrinogen decarboxylase family protein [Sulfuricystis thermophila]
MNSLERILAAVRFRPTDRVPLVPQLFGYAASAAGVRLGDYLRDGRLLAECQLRLRESFGCDAVFAFTDFSIEAEALGARLKYYDAQYPDIVIPALAPEEEAARLVPPEPTSAGRLPEVLRAIGLQRKALGDSACVMGALTGPMTLATQLYGTETALFLAADHPARFSSALDLALATALSFGTAQLAAGADAIVIFDPAASPAVVPADFFCEHLQLRLTRLVTGLRAAGAQIVWLNIAGPTAPILPLYAKIGVDIATFDYYIDAATAQRLLPHTCLAGNLKSLDFLLPEAAPRIGRQAAGLIEAFSARGGFILSSGCEIPPESEAATLRALAEAAASFPPCRG